MKPTPTLLFVDYGNAGIWDYVSSRLTPDLGEGTDDLKLAPIELAQILGAPGGLVMVIDTDWNGVNYYGFAPVGSGVKVASAT